MADIIDEILKNNGLEESDEDFFNKFDKDMEPRTLIIRDAALIIAQKKIPEEKLAELLQKHLETSQETSLKIVQDVKEKILPFATTLEEKKYPENDFQAELLRKIKSDGNILDAKTEQNEILVPQVIKPLIIDVEKNAGNIQKERKSIGRQETEEKTKPETTEQKPDNYLEPVE